MNRKHLKLAAVLLCLLCCLCGCGNTDAAGQQETEEAGQQETDAAGQQGTETAGQQETEEAGQQGTEAAGQPETESSGAQGAAEIRSPDSPLVVVRTIEVHRESKACHIGALIQTDSEVASTDYALNGVQILETQMTPAEGGVRIDWYGFYAGDEAEIAEPEVLHDFEVYTNVECEAALEETPGRKLEADVNGHTVAAWITPYSVSIEPEEEWRAEGTFYDVTVTDESGTEYFLVRLPVMDDRKPSQKEAYPLPDMNAGDLPQLGGEPGDLMVERENCGIQMAFGEPLSEETLRSLKEIRFDEIRYR